MINDKGVYSIVQKRQYKRPTIVGSYIANDQGKESGSNDAEKGATWQEETATIRIPI